MSQSLPLGTPEPAWSGRHHRQVVLLTVLALAIAVVSLTWAKWLPYVEKISDLASTASWDGSSILAAGGVRPGDDPSWHAATSFTAAYVGAVWKALLASLLISAALQTLVPQRWLSASLSRRSRIGSAALGGIASTPTMMCTCCTAPVVATMSRAGTPTSAAVAYWLGNPVLNPAVLVFLVLVAPWQWSVTRLAVGLLLVVFGSALVARLTESSRVSGRPSDLASGALAGGAASARGFGRSLLRLSLVLIPEYLVVVLVVGAFRGWLFPVGGDAVNSGLLLVAVAAIVGTLLVIPTGGEIPVLQGLALAGLSAGPIGALLVTLPAVSLPGMVMLWKALGARVVLSTAAVVAGSGAVGASVLVLLS